MRQSRRDVLDDFLDFIGQPADTNARNTAERRLNDAIERIWLKHTWRSFMLPEPYLLTTVANVRSYTLPPYFGRVSSKNQVLRNVTYPREIWPVDPQDYSRQNPRQGTTNEVPGNPCNYFIDGTWGIPSQSLVAGTVTTGEQLEVVSDQLLDVDVRVFVAGFHRITGAWQEVQVTLNGTTPVVVGAFKFIQTFSKAYAETITPATEFASSRGSVSLQISPASTVIDTLGMYESSREYDVLTLVPTPDAVYTIAIPILRQPLPLLYDSDPLPNHWGPAVFEEMTIQWRITQGKIALNSGIPRPDLANLVEHDNLGRLPLRRRAFDEG